MEEILLNIDSKYRNILTYPNEAKYRFNLEKNYKNIMSAKMTSIELNNSSTYVDSKKKNNFITIFLPDKKNDPNGTKLELEDGFYQVIGVYENVFNGLFDELFNKNSSLQTTYVDGNPFAEKYFYFFYLNNDIEIIFNFNSELLPPTLSSTLKISKGWYSIYGLVLQIQNYITDKYNERKIYISMNPSTPTIDLDYGNFSYNLFTLIIFDRRFRSTNVNGPTSYDCLRYDNIQANNFNSNNLTTNLNNFKNTIYQTYIYDINTFIPQTKTTYNAGTARILDQLNAGEYIIPNDPILISSGFITPNYKLKTQKLESESIYYLNISSTKPTTSSTQIYNLQMKSDLTYMKVAFSNNFTSSSSTTDLSKNYSFFYYYIPLSTGTQTWENIDTDITTNVFDNLFLSKKFLLDNQFITQSQYDDPFFIYTSEKDIANFEIDFNTYDLNNPVSNGLTDVKKMNYPPVGYYLGYRPDLTKIANNFTFTGIIDNTERLINGTKIFDTMGDNYIFLKLNDWGYIDFFGQKMFAKILLTSNLGNPRVDDCINKEYRFRQPQNINKLDVELVDYLGNTIELGGFDWSFTLELKQIVNSNDKTIIERTNLVFSNI